MVKDFKFNSKDITSLHQLLNEQWKRNDPKLQYDGFIGLTEQNHYFNFLLWLTEDKARRDDLGYEFVYQAKRKIDYFNQQRNNRVEMIDQWLFQSLEPAPSCAVHSETPGMMIDRLSILSLKIYHMAIEAKRDNVSETHRKNCSNKLTILKEQLNTLADCLEIFFEEIVNKTRTFKVYHQFKMYNDPTLNPELYQNPQLTKNQDQSFLSENADEKRG